MWLFTRLSALAMYGLILFAVIGALVMGARTQMNFADILRWAFMPNRNHVQNTNVPTWPLVDALLEAGGQRTPARCGGAWCAWTGGDRGRLHHHPARAKDRPPAEHHLMMISMSLHRSVFTLQDLLLPNG